MTPAWEARGLLLLLAISACESPTQTLCNPEPIQAARQMLGALARRSGVVSLPST